MIAGGGGREHDRDEGVRRAVRWWQDKQVEACEKHQNAITAFQKYQMPKWLFRSINPPFGDDGSIAHLREFVLLLACFFGGGVTSFYIGSELW